MSPTLVVSSAWRATATFSDRRRCLAGGRPAAPPRPAVAGRRSAHSPSHPRQFSPARPTMKHSDDHQTQRPRHRWSAVVRLIDGCVSGVTGDRHCMSPHDRV